MNLRTERLDLIASNHGILSEALKSNEHLAAHLKIKVPENWSEFGDSALKYALAQLNAFGADSHWLTYFPVHKEDNTLIGSCGYKSEPDEEGTVEIGYEIKSDYRNKGLATELVTALVQSAFKDPSVNSIQAHTLGEINPSTKVLTKCNFIKTGEIADEENGTIWKWELRRE